jgi:hypothetical protein
MINNYRTEIEGANRRELVELIEAYALGIDYHEVDDTYELREYTMDKLAAENNLYECVEDDILDTINNGNWSDAAKQMHDNYITPHGLIDYVDDYRYEQFDEAYDFFDLGSAATITELYYKKEVA